MFQALASFVKQDCEGLLPRLSGLREYKGLSPPPPLPLPLGSHLGTSLIGAEAGAEAPGRPPAGLVHDLPGLERAPPVSGLRPPHRGERAPEPAS